MVVVGPLSAEETYQKLSFLNKWQKKNVTVQKVFGDKEPADLSLEECKKAIEGKIKAKKAKAKKSKKKAPAKKKASS